jgi:hypothetical protein
VTKIRTVHRAKTNSIAHKLEELYFHAWQQALESWMWFWHKYGAVQGMEPSLPLKLMPGQMGSIKKSGAV